VSHDTGAVTVGNGARPPPPERGRRLPRPADRDSEHSPRSPVRRAGHQISNSRVRAEGFGHPCTRLRKPTPAELAEYPGAARVHRLQPLIENHPAARGVPGVLQRQGADLALLREQALDPVHSRATSRRSSSPSIALPIPRCRHAAARLIRITHARSPATVAAATPTSSSPTTAATAGSCDRTAAIRSDRPKAGASLLAAGLSHNRTKDSHRCWRAHRTVRSGQSPVQPTLISRPTMTAAIRADIRTGADHSE
jgi:hypothetical protein